MPMMITLITIPYVQFGIVNQVQLLTFFRRQCAGLPVQFTSSSSVTPGFIDNYEWSFGDGQTDTSENPIHDLMPAGYSW